MRRTTALLAALIAAIAILFAGCASSGNGNSGASAEDGKIEIVATLFPQYDFAREIAGDRAEVIMLLPAGTESHTYDPTPADMAEISGCDLFLYTGEYMEPWAAELAKTLDGGRAIDLSQGIELTGSHADGDRHEDSPDPHIWTDPLNAKVMAENIRDALIALDPEGESEYAENAEAYLEKLDGLDRELRETAENAKRKILVFGGRFAFHYLAEEYGFECHSAYDSCTAETEPSAAAVAELTELVVREGIPVIYYEELANPQVAEAIAAETGAETLLLHSCHNLSAEEREAGETYLSIMERNIRNIRAGVE